MPVHLLRGGVAAAIAAVALTLTACANGGGSASPTPSPSAQATGTWGDSVSESSPYLTLGSDGKVSGSDGCNRILGTWKAAGERIDFGDVATTRMACQGVDTWLSGMASATVDGDQMTVQDADGKTLGTLARAAGGASAGPTPIAPAVEPQPGEEDPIITGTWGEDASGKPNLRLQADGSLSGSDGCNLLSGSYTFTGGVITFSPLAATLMACPDVQTWLGGATTATVQGGTMTIYDGNATAIGTLNRAH